MAPLDATIRMSGDPREAVLLGTMAPAQRMAVALCCAMAAIDGYDMVAVTFAMPGIGAEWGTSKAVLGGLFSLGMIGMAIGCLILGPLSDIVGRRVMAIASLLAMTASMTLSALAPDITQLMIWRLCTGAGIGAVTSVAYPLSVEYSNLRARPMTLALMVISYPLGGAIGGAFAAHLIALLGWRATFLPGIVVPPIVILLGLKWLPEPPGLLIERPRPSSLKRVNQYLAAIGRHPVGGLPPPAHPGRTPVGRVLGREFLAVTAFLAGIYCLYSVTAYFLLAWLPQIVTELGFPPAVAATVSVTTNIGGIVGASITGFAIRRLGAIPVLTTLLLGLGGAVLLIGIAPADIAVLRLLGVIAGIFVFGPIVGVTLLIADHYPVEVRATGMGFIIGLTRWIAAIGPLIGGVLIASRLGIAGSCVLMAVIAFLAAGLVVLFHITERRVRSRPDPADIPASQSKEMV